MEFFTSVTMASPACLYAWDISYKTRYKKDML